MMASQRVGALPQERTEVRSSFQTVSVLSPEPTAVSSSDREARTGWRSIAVSVSAAKPETDGVSVMAASVKVCVLPVTEPTMALAAGASRRKLPFSQVSGDSPGAAAPLRVRRGVWAEGSKPTDRRRETYSPLLSPVRNQRLLRSVLAAANGAAFLCYVTPAEHLALPNVEDVKQGIIASRIAAHAADIAKKVPHARDLDDAMADARRTFDWEKQWECAIDPETAKHIREDRAPEQEDSCSMCGKFCAVRSMNKALNGEYIDIL